MYTYNPDDKLEVKVYKDVTIMPFEGSMDSFSSGAFYNNKLIENSIIDRCTPVEPKKAELTIGTTCFFGGYLFNHFGHFLLESLNRYYALKINTRIPVVFVSPDDDINPWQKQIFKLLNIENQIFIIKKPTQVRELIIASPASSALKAMREEQFEALGVFASKDVVKSRKIWLSRSNWRFSKVHEEKHIENEISRSGWSIIHPEQLSVEQQLTVLTKAEFVAGLDGSAFYLSLLCKELKNNFIIFSRRNYLVPMMLDFIVKRGAKLHTYMPEAVSMGGYLGTQNFSIKSSDITHVLKNI